MSKENDQNETDQKPLIRKKTLQRDGDRGIYSTVNVSKYQEFEDNEQVLNQFDGTGNF